MLPDFRVESALQELKRRAPDRAALIHIAESTRGKYFPVEKVEELPKEIPGGHPVLIESGEPILLWNRWELLLLFSALLLSEWIYRKRFRLL